MAKISNGEVKEAPCEKLASLFLTHLPLEIRFKIFDELLNSHHTSIISPNEKQ
jgi:hypothetical protein